MSHHTRRPAASSLPAREHSRLAKRAHRIAKPLAILGVGAAALVLGMLAGMWGRPGSRSVTQNHALQDNVQSSTDRRPEPAPVAQAGDSQHAKTAIDPSHSASGPHLRSASIAAQSQVGETQPFSSGVASAAKTGAGGVQLSAAALPARAPGSTQPQTHRAEPELDAASTQRSFPATRPAFTFEPLAVPPADLTDAQIEQAMRRAVDFLLTQFEEGEISLRFAENPSRRAGLDALAVYSLLQASRSIHDDRINPKLGQMRLMLEKLKAYRIEPSDAQPFEPVVYGRGLRAAALAVYNRPEDKKTLRADVAWLVSDEVDGAYSYGEHWTPPPQPIAWKPMGDPNPPVRGRVRPGGIVGSGGGAAGGSNMPTQPPRTPIYYPPPPPENPKFLIRPPQLSKFNQPLPLAPGQPLPPSPPPRNYGPPANSPDSGGSSAPNPGLAQPPAYSPSPSGPSFSPPVTAPPSGGYGGGCAAPGLAPDGADSTIVLCSAQT
ncbi:MAG TPA: hypothetical protein VFC78_15045, partial [Tepidisphaeraceae bacterium]|nr:hypothetical protein [Tepidisphaeraceae bacterium]